MFCVIFKGYDTVNLMCSFYHLLTFLSCLPLMLHFVLGAGSVRCEHGASRGSWQCNFSSSCHFCGPWKVWSSASSSTWCSCCTSPRTHVSPTTWLLFSTPRWVTASLSCELDKLQDLVKYVNFNDNLKESLRSDSCTSLSAWSASVKSQRRILKLLIANHEWGWGVLYPTLCR